MQLGAGKAMKLDFRLVCATHRDLEQMVQTGAFREDLYARIAQERVYLPPLRERREEIAHLIALDLKPKGIRPEPEFIEACLLYEWPRNVRELRSAVQSAARRAGIGGRATIDDLDPAYRAGAATAPEVLEEIEEEEAPAVEPDHPRWPDVKRLYMELGNAAKAGQLAGVPASTAARWVKDAGLVREKRGR